MSFLFHRKVRKQKGCAASRAEQKLRFSDNLDARVCEAHFCSKEAFQKSSLPEANVSETGVSEAGVARSQYSGNRHFKNKYFRNSTSGTAFQITDIKYQSKSNEQQILSER